MEEIIASTYRIIRKLGSGGGGNVYLADHLRLNKKVVLKADKRRITTKTALLRREADVLKNLNHPNIPKVYDFFVEEDTVYTVMDYIEGESLDRPLKRGEHFSQPQVIQWAKELLDALDYLHSPTHGDPPRGFVHSDIKPANLMRTPDNHIVLIDFNIALSLGEDTVIGCSAGYASPEHYGLDFSSDSDTVNGESETEAESKFGQDSETEVDDPTVERTITESDTESTEKEEGNRKEKSFSASPKKIIVPDVRSDIYSTGATLYHLLSGSKPAKKREGGGIAFRKRIQSTGCKDHQEGDESEPGSEISDGAGYAFRFPASERPGSPGQTIEGGKTAGYRCSSSASCGRCIHDICGIKTDADDGELAEACGILEKRP